MNQNEPTQKRPLFSIATPCWNSEKTIERTLKSVLAQEFKDYEYLIVDGGSTDGTLDIIRKYEPLFEGRMHWKSEPDGGLYDAFNKGVARSTGIYCWNVNSDDYMEEGALQKLADFITAHSWERLPVVSGGMRFVSQEGEELLKLYPRQEGLETAYRNDCIGVSHPSTLVPKEMYDRHGAFDSYYKIMGDADWYHRVYAAGEKFALVDFIVTNMSDGGISNQYIFRKDLRDRLYYYKKFYSNPFERFFKLAEWAIYYYRLKYTQRRLFKKNQKK